ncbi:hypothetical protein GCM10011512_20890 [Tersicoccus solisilvae]|uniref:YtxH domain-containing protein n=1 Tax=Tersicoccus solisilvae TaxID=1882339 RepID=A0ABQ1PA60_9MICC|nr:YtxH domain-containing protein [Tersicoccus solisilvae]GGC93700.1 hypothetical protein GCM10011512_20890 [Tersicoccus solisilvae]
MLKKAIFLVGAGVGFVLGTRAGRETYDKLRAQVTGFVNDPKVQEKVSQGTEWAKDKAPVVAGKVQEGAEKIKGAASDAAGTVSGKASDAADSASAKADQAVGTIKDRTSGDDGTDPETGGTSSDYEPHVVDQGDQH